MPSDRLSTLRRENRPSRRRFLAALGGLMSVPTAGCSETFSVNDSSRADETIEVSAENRTSSRAAIAVRVIDNEEETLFSRVFDLESGTIASRGAIETPPSRVHAFTPDGASHTWRYVPDLPVDFECEREDIGLTLHQDNTIEPWYTC